MTGGAMRFLKKRLVGADNKKNPFETLDLVALKREFVAVQSTIPKITTGPELTKHRRQRIEFLLKKHSKLSHKLSKDESGKYCESL